MRKKLLTALLTSVFILGGATQTFATNTGETKYSPLYAQKGFAIEKGMPTKGNKRAILSNAFGKADVNNFYSLDIHELSKFEFDKTFYNVNTLGESDIEFYEVTWGNSWHEEVVEVYLVNPVVKTECNPNGKLYGTNDLVNAESNQGINITKDGEKAVANDHLYFAGVAYNKMGQNNIEKYEQYEKDRLSEITGKWPGIERGFIRNTTRISENDSNTLITGFNLPEEVVSAEGIVLVDVTKKYNLKVNNKKIADDDDGFDLDAIKVWGME